MLTFVNVLLGYCFIANYFFRCILLPVTAVICCLLMEDGKNLLKGEKKEPQKVDLVDSRMDRPSSICSNNFGNELNCSLLQDKPICSLRIPSFDYKVVFFLPSLRKHHCDSPSVFRFYFFLDNSVDSYYFTNSVQWPYFLT